MNNSANNTPAITPELKSSLIKQDVYLDLQEASKEITNIMLVNAEVLPPCVIRLFAKLLQTNRMAKTDETIAY